MARLFELPKIEPKVPTKEKAKAAASKANKPKKGPKTALFALATSAPVPTIKKGVAGKIEALIENVKRFLGDEMDKYDCIRNDEDFINYIDKCIENNIAVIDTETDGLNYINDQIAGICIYTPGLKPAYVPINHMDYITGAKQPDQVSKELAAEQMQRLKDNNVRIIYHNAKFDMHVLNWNLSVKYLSPYWDTQIGGQVLNENELHGLKYLYEKYIVGTPEPTELATFNKLFNGVPFTLVPIQYAYVYAAKDTKMTYDVYKFQEQFLDENHMVCKQRKMEDMAQLFKKIEMPLLEIVTEMEDTGIALDMDYTKSLSEKYNLMMNNVLESVNTELEKYTEKIKAFATVRPDLVSKLSTPINIGSPTQLAILLYDILRLKSPDSKNPRGTGEDILLAIKHPLCEKILEFRGLKKLVSTYIDKLPKEINDKTGRIHASFNQYGAKTGRFSSSEPNLQNIPSHNTDIRKMFIAGNVDGQDYVLVGGDFSQQEPRLLAHMSEDDHLINAYMEGKDIYATIASGIYKVEYHECLEFNPDGSKNPDGKKRRNNTKSIVLGIMYGRGAASIAEQTGMTKEEAQAIIDDFFKAFPKVKKFVDNSIAFAKQFGYVTTAYGRKRRLPDIQLPEVSVTGKVDAGQVARLTQQFKSIYGRQMKDTFKNDLAKQGIIIKDNGGFIAQAERQCVNSRIQGGAADISKKAMLAIGTNQRLKEIGYTMLVAVHDEIIGMCPREHALEAMELQRKLMVGCCTDKISVPMKCDMEILERWYGEDITDKLTA